MRAPESEKVGAAIRKLRLARGWTLAELASQTGIPLSTLSRVELGQNALKYDKLVRLCRALEVDLQGLVAREAETLSVATGRRSVVRAGEGRAVRHGANLGRVAGDELTDRSLTPMLIEIRATTLEEHGPLVRFPSEGYLLVVAGKVRFVSEFYAPTELGEGDAIYFDGRAGHAILAVDPSGARAVLVAAGEVAYGA